MNTDWGMFSLFVACVAVMLVTGWAFGKLGGKRA